MAEEEKRAPETVSYIIQDDREASALKLPRAGNVLFKNLRSLTDLQRLVCQELKIPISERDLIAFSYQGQGTKLSGTSPAELLRRQPITIVVSDHDSVSHPSEVVDVDRSRGAVEHINPMPSFSIHQAQAAGHHVPTWDNRRRRTSGRTKYPWKATTSSCCLRPSSQIRSRSPRSTDPVRTSTRAGPKP